jgi:DNA (cytosine-5)-methyltransferase 1
MRFELIVPLDFSMPPISWNPYSVDSSNRTTHQDHVKKRLETLKPGKQDKISRRTRLHPNRLSPTLRAGTKEEKGSHTAVRPVHYKYHRVISVREGARLMGYPDWMTFHKAKWHGFRLVGNGVPFPLSNVIAKQIKNLLYESES